MLDPATLFLAVALIDTAGAVILFILWARSRHVVGLRLLAVGMSVLALGIWLQMLRPLMPPALGIVLANTAIQAGHGTVLIAISRLVGRAEPLGAVILLVLAATGAFIYFAVVEPQDVAIRVVVTSVVIGTLLAGSAFQLFRSTERQDRVVHRALGGVIAVAAVFMFGRALLTHLRGSVPDMLTSDPLNIGLLLVSIVLGFVYIVGFILLVSHRLQTRLDDAIPATDERWLSDR